MSYLTTRQNYKIQTISDVDYIDLKSGILHQKFSFGRVLLRLVAYACTKKGFSTLAILLFASFLIWKTVSIIGRMPQTAQVIQQVANIDDISISNFQTQFHSTTARVFLTLSTNGRTSEYPTLIINWVGSGKESIRLTSADYPHPAGLFNGSLDVDFYIQKPANSTALSISAQYD